MKTQFLRTATFEVLREGRVKGAGFKVRLVKAHDIRGDVFYVLFFYRDKAGPEKYWDQRGSGYDLAKEIRRFENVIENR